MYFFQTFVRQLENKKTSAICEGMENMEHYFNAFIHTLSKDEEPHSTTHHFISIILHFEVLIIPHINIEKPLFVA